MLGLFLFIDYFGLIVKLLQIISLYFSGSASKVATGGLVWLVDAWTSDLPGGSDWCFTIWKFARLLTQGTHSNLQMKSLFFGNFSFPFALFNATFRTVNC